MNHKENVTFKSVIFDFKQDQFQILNGTEGMYSFKDIARFTILNEKADSKGKDKPFSAILPKSGLPAGIFCGSQLYVGIKIVTVKEEILAIYISEKETQVGTDQYIKDKKEAEEICELLKQATCHNT